MRVSLLTPEYPPGQGLGGIATHTETIARALARAGHEVVVVTPGRPGESLENGVTILRIDVGQQQMIGADWFRRNRRLAKATLAWQPDVALAAECAATAWWLARFTRVPVVTRLATPTGIVAEVNGQRWGARTHLKDFLERDQTRRSAAVYAPTRAVAQRVRVRPAALSCNDQSHPELRRASCDTHRGSLDSFATASGPLYRLLGSN